MIITDRCQLLPGIIETPDKVMRELARGCADQGLELRDCGISSAVRLHTNKTGPRVLIFGGVHADERCGVFAIQKLLGELGSGRMRLNCGELTLAIGNAEGLPQNVRYVLENLNRLFRDDLPEGNSYEYRRAQELKGLIRTSDYFIDLHSTFLPTIPYILAEKHLVDVAKRFGYSNIVTGWSELGATAVAGDSETYSHRYNVKGFTVECGQHVAQTCFQNAYETARRFIEFAGLSDPSIAAPNSGRVVVHSMKEVFTMPQEGFRYAADIEVANFTRIFGGQVIGYAGARPVLAAYDATLILPKDPSRVKPGEELFILATSSRG